MQRPRAADQCQEHDLALQLSPAGHRSRDGSTWPCRSSYSLSCQDVGSAAERQRPQGAQRTFGPEIAGAELARRWARKLKGAVADGLDPATDRKQHVRQATEARTNKLGPLVDHYARLFPTRPKLRGSGARGPLHVEGELQALRAAIAEMDASDLPATQLTRVMIQRMLDGRGNQPAAARHRFGALSRFCDWLLDDERNRSQPVFVGQPWQSAKGHGSPRQLSPTSAARHPVARRRQAGPGAS